MHTDRETTRLVRSWLEEGATALPDRVLDAVLDQVPTTPQRSAWWPARRSPEMSNIAKVLIAAAAVVAVALVGFNFLPRNANVGGPAPTASPTPTPSSTPSASPSPALGPLDPGTYRIGDVGVTTVPFTFTVPAGWTGRADGYVFKEPDEPGGLAFDVSVVTHVYADACKSEGTLTPVGPTVDDLVSALVDQADSDATAPVDVTFGGHPAKRVDISIPADLDSATCRHGGEAIQIWADERETDFFALPDDARGLRGRGVRRRRRRRASGDRHQPPVDGVGERPRRARCRPRLDHVRAVGISAVSSAQRAGGPPGHPRVRL